MITSIMKINTGEKLDIVYTTDSLIVTTPMDGHTSEIITRLEIKSLQMASLMITNYKTQWK